MLRPHPLPVHQCQVDRGDVRRSWLGDDPAGDLLPVSGDVTLAFLWCDRCVPPWEINHIPIERPPWSVVDWQAGDRFRCPGCRGAVGWHIPGPTWRPSDRK